MVPLPSRRLAVTLGAWLCATAVAVPVFAQDTTGDRVTAEALYKTGRDLLAEEKWQEACEKFDASMKLNERVTTLMNIAQCHEHFARLTDALAAYKRAIPMLEREEMLDARRKAIDTLARESIAALEPRLPKLRIMVESPPAGLTVERNGRPVLPAMLGLELPVDPGTHEVVASAPGFRTDKRELELAESQQETLTLTLEPLPELPPPVVLPPPPPPLPPPPPEGGVPAWSWVAGGAGLALIGAGVAFRFDQMAAEDTLLEQCGQELLCDPAGGYDFESDNARKNRGFGLFVGLTAAGGVGVAAAVVGIITGVAGGDHDEQSAWRLAPMLAPGAQGAWLEGCF